MGIHKFTHEQRAALQNNIYVKNVTENSITYTTEFKDLFYEEYTNGKGPTEILKSLGFDPALLGKRRIDGIVQRLKNNALRSGGNKDLRKNSSGRPKRQELSLEEQVAQLKYQNELLKQENEFLKKTRKSIGKRHGRRTESRKIYVDSGCLFKKKQYVNHYLDVRAMPGFQECLLCLGQ